MIYLVLILVLVVVGLLVKLVLLKRTMRDVYRQLWGISDNLDTNWAIKLSTPDKDMAELATLIGCWIKSDCHRLWLFAMSGIFRIRLKTSATTFAPH